MKKILICAVLLIFSGCLGNDNDYKEHNFLGAKYLSNNSDTILFANDTTILSDMPGLCCFYATEYLEFTQQTVELTGTYKIIDDELILTYKMFGAVRRFQILNNSHTLVEKDEGMMRFDR